MGYSLVQTNYCHYHVLRILQNLVGEVVAVGEVVEELVVEWEGVLQDAVVEEVEEVLVQVVVEVVGEVLAQEVAGEDLQVGVDNNNYILKRKSMIYLKYIYLLEPTFSFTA